MLSKVTAKNVEDVFWDTLYMYMCSTLRFDNRIIKEVQMQINQLLFSAFNKSRSSALFQLHFIVHCRRCMSKINIDDDDVDIN